MEIILASKSPRRRDLLKMMGVSYTAIVSDIDESGLDALSPDEMVSRLAYEKARVVLDEHTGSCVIGADTIVFLDDRIIGKPKDERDAFRILKSLRGRTHTVYTGIAVLTKDSRDVRVDRTKVTFSNMTDQEIRWYISTGETSDKAGAYGMQGVGGIFIEKIEGNYFAAIGMNINILYDMLKKAGAI